MARTATRQTADGPEKKSKVEPERKIARVAPSSLGPHKPTQAPTTRTFGNLMAMQGVDGDNGLASRIASGMTVSEQPEKVLMGPPAAPGPKAASDDQTFKDAQKHSLIQQGPPIRSGFLTNPWVTAKLPNGKSPAKEEDALALLAFAASSTASWRPKNVDRRRSSNDSTSSTGSLSEVGGAVRLSASDAAKKIAKKPKKPRKAYSIAGRPRARGEYKCGRCGFLPKKAKHSCEVENARRAQGLAFSPVTEMEDENDEDEDDEVFAR